MEQAIANLLLNAAVHAPALGRIWITAGSGINLRRFSSPSPTRGPGPIRVCRTSSSTSSAGAPRPAAAGWALVCPLSTVSCSPKEGGSRRKHGAEGGSRFILSLPRVHPEAVPSRMNPERKSEILLVDDEAQLRRLLRYTLEEAGYAVREAETARTALGEIALQAPDLLILDLGLPDTSGAEVLRAMRPLCSVPVLILSVLGHEQSKIAALDAGADDYLTKPFDGGRTPRPPAGAPAPVSHADGGREEFSFWADRGGPGAQPRPAPRPDGQADRDGIQAPAAPRHAPRQGADPPPYPEGALGAAGREATPTTCGSI